MDAAKRQRGATEVAEDLGLTPSAREHYLQAVDTVAAGRPLQPEAVRRVLDSLPVTWSTPEERRVAELQQTREGREVLARIAKGSHGVY
jgi:DNA-binding NarL/FixJ family response regulator